MTPDECAALRAKMDLYRQQKQAARAAIQPTGDMLKEALVAASFTLIQCEANAQNDSGFRVRLEAFNRPEVNLHMGEADFYFSVADVPVRITLQTPSDEDRFPRYCVSIAVKYNDKYELYEGMIINEEQIVDEDE